MSENVPKVRFQGFTGEWKTQKFKNFIVKTGQKNSGGENYISYSVNNKLGLTRQDEQFDGSRLDILDKSAYKLVHPNEFAYNPARINVGSIAFNNLERTVIVSSLYVVFKMSEKINNNYILQFIKSPAFINEVRRNTEGSVREYLFFDSIKNIKFPYIENYEEQKRIGTFFEQLDDTIALQKQLVEQLQQYKKVMLQKMFPQKGEIVPRVRFKGFTDGFKQRKLVELTTVITKGTTPKDKSGMGDINFIKVENIDSSSGEISITSKVSSKEHEGYLKRSQLEIGDILFSIAGTLGRVTIVEKNILPANTNQALAIIRLKEGDTNFITTYLKGKAVEDYIRKNPTVGAQPNLSLQQVGNLIIDYPSNQEQTRIGNFFKRLDDTIALHQKKLVDYQQLKKALLQRMFI